MFKGEIIMLYSIGEFATFCGLNVKTLRYYDEIGLLKPVKVDPFTKYRYYSDKQLDDVELIKTLKSCSFSWEEISQNWGNFNTSVIRNKKSELLRHVQDVMQQVEVLDFLDSQSQNLGIEEVSDEYALDNKSVKVRRKITNTPVHN